MHLLILGGTGPSGIKIIEEALSASHTVVAYARSPEKLPESISSHASVTIVQGELTDVAKLTKALEGVDAVLSALGPNSPSHPSDTPIARAYTVIIDAMKTQRVKRLIASATPSAKDEHDRFSLTFTLLVAGIWTFARPAYNDIVAIGQTIRSQGDELDWTIVRVPFLTDKETKDVVAGYVGDGKTGATLSRAGFAAFFVQELEKGEWIKKAPLISSG